MTKFIINDNATLIKNILIEESVIYASDENYNTKIVFLEKINNPKKSILDTHHKIPISTILKFIPFENELGIQLFFTENGKDTKTYFEFNSTEEYTEFKNYLSNETKFILKNEVKSNHFSWLKKAMYAVIAIIITAITYSNAKDIENGNTIRISGSKRGLQRLMKTLAENLGTTNTLIFGTIVFCSLSFWTYSTYKKGKTTIDIYEKQ